VVIFYEDLANSNDKNFYAKGGEFFTIFSLPFYSGDKRRYVIHLDKLVIMTATMGTQVAKITEISECIITGDNIGRTLRT
jgi:hypothetical protein